MILTVLIYLHKMGISIGRLPFPPQLHTQLINEVINVQVSLPCSPLQPNESLKIISFRMSSTNLIKRIKGKRAIWHYPQKMLMVLKKRRPGYSTLIMYSMPLKWRNRLNYHHYRPGITPHKDIEFWQKCSYVTWKALEGLKGILLLRG